MRCSTWDWYTNHCDPSSPPAILSLLECQLNCPEIFTNPSFSIFVDGGIRRGSDILKCLCLGATAIGLGRPVLYALNYGQQGVEHLLETLATELATAMALVGITDLAQAEPGLVWTGELDALVAKGEGHPYAVKKVGGTGGGVRAKL